jgi:micrococcal nuclease
MSGPYTYIVDHIIRVIDGDTVEACVNLGFHIQINLVVRLYNIDAVEPKKDPVMADKAKKHLEKLLSETPLMIHTIKDRRGKFGRWLAEIINCYGVNCGEQMIRDGYATRYNRG